MTNTYDEDSPIEVKIHEELRCIRCAMERLMRIIGPQEFVDYQMEKFGVKFKRVIEDYEDIIPKLDD